MRLFPKVLPICARLCGFEEYALFSGLKRCSRVDRLVEDSTPVTRPRQRKTGESIRINNNTEKTDARTGIARKTGAEHFMIRYEDILNPMPFSKVGGRLDMVGVSRNALKQDYQLVALH
jgi:hypothetical protein